MDIVSESGRIVDFPLQSITKSFLWQIVPRGVDNFVPIREALRQLVVAKVLDLGKMFDRVDHLKAAAGTKTRVYQPRHLPTRDNCIVCKGLALKA